MRLHERQTNKQNPTPHLQYLWNFHNFVFTFEGNKVGTIFLVSILSPFSNFPFCLFLREEKANKPQHKTKEENTLKGLPGSLKDPSVADTAFFLPRKRVNVSGNLCSLL